MARARGHTPHISVIYIAYVNNGTGTPGEEDRYNLTTAIVEIEVLHRANRRCKLIVATKAAYEPRID